MGAILLSGAAFLFGSTLVVAIRYLLRWRVIRDSHGKHLAVLPLHVWTIALSYDMLLLGLSIQSCVLVRWWHPYVYLPAEALGLYAMWVLGRAQSRGTS